MSASGAVMPAAGMGIFAIGQGGLVEGMRAMRAIVIFDSLFGNTERVAKSLAKGLQEAGVEAKYANIESKSIDKVSRYDLIALGAPTQFETASRPMKEFLEQMKDFDLKGKYGFAFDTRLDDIMAGSAAEYIEKRLEVYGLEILRPRRSATVVWQEEKREGAREPRTQANIIEGTEESFEVMGKELGELLKGKEQRVKVA